MLLGMFFKNYMTNQMSFEAIATHKNRLSKEMQSWVNSQMAEQKNQKTTSIPPNEYFTLPKNVIVHEIKQNREKITFSIKLCN